MVFGPRNHFRFSQVIPAGSHHRPRNDARTTPGRNREPEPGPTHAGRLDTGPGCQPAPRSSRDTRQKRPGPRQTFTRCRDHHRTRNGHRAGSCQTITGKCSRIRSDTEHARPRSDTDRAQQPRRTQGRRPRPGCDNAPREATPAKAGHNAPRRPKPATTGHRAPRRSRRPKLDRISPGEAAGPGCRHRAQCTQDDDNRPPERSEAPPEGITRPEDAARPRKDHRPQKTRRRINSIYRRTEPRPAFFHYIGKDAETTPGQIRPGPGTTPAPAKYRRKASHPAPDQKTTGRGHPRPIRRPGPGRKLRRAYSASFSIVSRTTRRINPFIFSPRFSQ